MMSEVYGEYDWTCGNPRHINVEHVAYIGSGGFGEVHKVRTATIHTLTNKDAKTHLEHGARVFRH